MQELSTSSEVAFAYRKTVTTAYRDAMRMQFRAMVGTGMGLPAIQHRDSVWTFLVGWWRCLYYKSEPLEISLFAREFGPVFKSDWLPSNDWEFWH